MILLEEDKLNELYEEYVKALEGESAEENWEIYVAKAQLKKVVECLKGHIGCDKWGNPTIHIGVNNAGRIEYQDFWQALLKEIE